MNLNLLRDDVQQFLITHLKDDVSKVALSKSPFADVSSQELATQIDGKQRAEKKLPSWFGTSGVIYPPKLSLEQCSSEATANYKSQLVKGNSLIDLTGGLGVDDYYFGKNLSKVVHCEQNQELSAIAEHNLRLLGAQNVRFVSDDSLDYLSATDECFDNIYVDPSRRVLSKKVFLLRETVPDVVSNLPLLLSKAPRIIIKTSPLFDIQSGLTELKHVSEVHVVSVKNDCKELIWIIDRGFIGEPVITCTALGLNQQQSFSFRLSEEQATDLNRFYCPGAFLFEPDVALLKGGAFKSIVKGFHINKLHPNSHLYTSDQVAECFIGKIFRISSVTDYKSFLKQNHLKKANVITRNFPLGPEELKKKHKIADGGQEFLIFTTVFPNSLQVVRAVLY